MTDQGRTPHHIGRLPSNLKTSQTIGKFGLATGFGIAILIVAGVWSQHAMRESLYEILEQSLRSVLRAEVSDLTLWLEKESTYVQGVAGDSQFKAEVDSISRLVKESGGDRDTLLRATQQAFFRDFLGEEVEQRGYIGFLLMAPDGLVLSSSRTSMIGKKLAPEGMKILTEILQDGRHVIKPVLPETFVEDQSLEGVPPIMVSGAPVTEDSHVHVAVLGFLTDPAGDFSQIVGKAGLGKTGHTMAFDSRGFLLNASRHEDELRDLGLLPKDASQTSILTVRLANPGGNLRRNYKPTKPIAELPLTEMAAAATSGRSGINLVGYRDYRGVRVVGAWESSTDGKFCIATELELSEAMSVLRPLRIAGNSLFLLLVLAVGVGIHRSYRLQSLKTVVDEVKYLGQYELIEKIGEGGMGSVYRAKHAMLRRPTAIKLLRKDIATPESIARFEREVQMTCQLTHPNTIEIYDYGQNPQGLFYYAMEYLSGFNLADLVEIEEHVPPSRVIYLLRQILESVGEAHSVGLIHRDIKLLNIFLCKRGGKFDFIKVLDFGLVKDLVNPDPAYLTSPGLIAGTPHYMAPERITSPLSVDLRSDLYSVGCVAFNLLTGKNVFEATSNEEILHHITNTPASRTSEVMEAEIPQGLDDFVAMCLSKKPEDRPKDARDAIALLDTIHLESKWTQKEAEEWWKRNPPKMSKEETQRDIESQRDKMDSIEKQKPIVS